MKLIGLEKIRNRIEQCGPLRILFVGETGVGKTPFARYSNQVVGKDRAFEQVNCAGLTCELFQDQFYGHIRGAFTGAVQEKKGFVELAEGGDLFLDEIGDMPLDTQALLLTFLDHMEYYRLGCDKKRRANVRIICATNRDLAHMVEEGSFRKDLYSRISQVIIKIPPLRQRKDEIYDFIHYFMNEYLGYEKLCSEDLLDILNHYEYRNGNIRELKYIVEYMCILGRYDQILTTRHLPENILRPQEIVIDGPDHEINQSAQLMIGMVLHHGLEKALSNVESKIISHYLDKYKNVDKMGAVLRISKPTLYRRMRKYGIAS